MIFWMDSICSTMCPVAVGSIEGRRMLKTFITSWKSLVYRCTTSMGSMFSSRAFLPILSSPSSVSPVKWPTSVMFLT